MKIPCDKNAPYESLENGTQKLFESSYFRGRKDSAPTMTGKMFIEKPIIKTGLENKR